jgi:hypothetical protein
LFESHLQIHRSSDIVSRLSEDERVAVLQRISRLEQLYSVIDCYRWLATRFGSSVYVDVNLAEKTALECAEEIELLIAKLGLQRKKGMRKR